MPKLTILNRAQPEWDVIIETNLRVMLGSILAGLGRIDVEFDAYSDDRGHGAAYRCQLVMTELSGAKHLLENIQPDGKRAIEGALSRGRRLMSRRKYFVRKVAAGD